jgi:hypothetical protein
MWSRQLGRRCTSRTIAEGFFILSAIEQLRGHKSVTRSDFGKKTLQ